MESTIKVHYTNMEDIYRHPFFLHTINSLNVIIIYKNVRCI
jgi:hypothetical protein